MKIILGSDEKTNLTEAIVNALSKREFEVQLIGPLIDQGGSWPSVAKEIAEMVRQGEADEGILCCWTGTGVTIAANKVPGVRAALCGDAETARGAKLWNNANILCLSLRKTSEAVALEILESWFSTEYKPNPEDDACLAILDEMDQEYRPSKSRSE
jgi:ribose 5-phosphate isomerase B